MAAAFDEDEAVDEDYEDGTNAFKFGGAAFAHDPACHSETPLALIAAIAFLCSVGAHYANLPILLMLTSSTCIWASAFGINQIAGHLHLRLQIPVDRSLRRRWTTASWPVYYGIFSSLSGCKCSRQPQPKPH